MKSTSRPDILMSSYTGLPPAGATQPVLLILGSYPSLKSLQHQEYYGNPHNQFWMIMETVLGVSASLPYQKRLEGLSSHGILLWDVLFSCIRKGSSDNTIQKPVPNDIKGLLKEYPTIRCIALNGVTGAGKFFHTFFSDLLSESTITVTVLPSTSPAFAGMSLSEKVTKWKIIRKYICQS